MHKMRILTPTALVEVNIATSAPGCIHEAASKRRKPHCTAAEYITKNKSTTSVKTNAFSKVNIPIDFTVKGSAGNAIRPQKVKALAPIVVRPKGSSGNKMSLL